jgi:hypothetical protein
MTGTGIAQVALQKLNIALDSGQICATACTEIVKDAHALPLCQQGMDKVGTNKAGPAGD